MHYHLIKIIEELIKNDFWDKLAILATIFLNALTVFFIHRTYKLTISVRQDNHLPILIVNKFRVYTPSTQSTFQIYIHYKVEGFVHYHSIKKIIINNHEYNQDKFIEPNNSSIDIYEVPKDHIFLEKINELKIIYHDIHERKFTATFKTERKTDKTDPYWEIKEFKLKL